VVWGEDLVYKAIDQWNREIPIIASRGKISDRNGQLLAGNRTTYSVFVRPNAVVNKEYAATILSGVFSVDAEELLEKLNSNKVSEITVARQVSKESIEKLVSYDIGGVYYSKDNTRVYSYDDVLCQVLGFTASDGTGITGLEKYYDNILSGTNGEIMYTTDILGIQTENAKIVYSGAKDGDEIRLTIDIDIQLAAEDAIRSVYASSGAKSASCIVLDPNNFDVLAMVNYPSYNLNDVPRDDTEVLNEQTRNGIVSDIYEPGSTFKVLTAAADIEEYLRGNKSAFSPNYVFNSSRTRVVDGTKIKCWSDHANGKHSNQTLSDALNNSCNPCFTDIALALGSSTFYDYLYSFGLGNVTGIDFSGEAVGMLVTQSAVRDCDLARIGFGQTVAVTALQLACAAASAVNGGNYYVPHLVKSVISADGKTENSIEPTLKNNTISSQASEILREMLEGVVKEGSGKKAYIEGYRVGGKTGTAQKYENGKIAAGKYVSSFVGFFPANDPQYLALIVVDEPQGVYYGSAVAAPVAKEIFEDIIAIKNIKPVQ
jgi:stage V sporulation protein D (sporulation-specific penicillin-binding protein)